MIAHKEGGKRWNHGFQVVLTIFSSVLASSGLWAYLQKKASKKM